jgi:RNA polymerase sigma-70 factor (ECF subfamily)
LFFLQKPVTFYTYTDNLSNQTKYELTGMTDEQAMQSVKEGNLDHVALLFERYHIRFYNFFLRFTIDKAVSEDLTQNLFMRIIKYKDGFDAQRQFKPWAYQIARNMAYKEVKSSAKQEAFLDVERAASLESSATVAEQNQREREAILQQAIMLLPAEQRELLVLSRYQGLKYKEIGQMMKVEESTIKVRVHRAMKRLKDLYLVVEQKQ